MPEARRPGDAAIVAEPADGTRHRRGAVDPASSIRASDLEPYTGLRYLSTLFRIMAGLLVLLLVAEGVASAVALGRAALPTILAQASRLLVMAGILWGIGDLALLLIDVGHDVRATRILLGRQAAHDHALPMALGETAGDRRHAHPADLAHQDRNE
jgi:hypothetical protein